jgi:hypothetical protein
VAAAVARSGLGYAIDLGVPHPDRRRGWDRPPGFLRPFDSMLSETADPRRAPELLVLRERIRSWRFYDHLRTDAQAPARTAQVGTRTPVLSHDGADLAAALQTIREIGDVDALDEAVGHAFSRQPRRDHRAGEARQGPAISWVAPGRGAVDVPVEPQAVVSAGGGDLGGRAGPAIAGAFRDGPVEVDGSSWSTRPSTTTCSSRATPRRPAHRSRSTASPSRSWYSCPRYPSHNETFGLPILEAMACGCPVVTSQVSSMPEIAGGAAILRDPADPADPASIAEALMAGVAPDRDRLRDMGFGRAGEFTWAVAAASTLDVYREVAERRRA